PRILGDAGTLLLLPEIDEIRRRGIGSVLRGGSLGHLLDGHRERRGSRTFADHDPEPREAVRVFREMARPVAHARPAADHAGVAVGAAHGIDLVARLVGTVPVEAPFADARSHL